MEIRDDCPGNARNVVLPVAPDISLACRLHVCAPEAPTLFYCPGGEESRASFNGEAEHFVRHGMNVFLASYRGCGGNSGIPSVSALLSDTRSLLPLADEWLTAQGFSGPLFVMGRSLGSVCAIDVVSVQGEKVKGLILESGFCETAPLLRALGAEPDAIPDSEDRGFGNIRKIAGIKLPTMIFHGAKDSLVPMGQAEKLQAAAGARNKQFFIIPGAEHHTVGQTGGMLYYQKLKEFIDAVCGVNTWRERRRQLKSGRTGEST